MDWILANKEWLFSGIGVTVVVVLLSLIRRGKKRDQVANVKQNQTTNIHIAPLPYSNSPTQLIHNQASCKDTIHILFVDDEKFNMINILKKAGWKNVSYKKDVHNIDDSEIQCAQIIFIDINGVGCDLFNNQGLGLAAAIKTKYPEKKVIIYSAESTGNRFDEDLRIVDACLPKNAEPIQFINLIEEYIHE